MVGDHFARMNAVLWQCYSLFILVLFPEKEAKSQGEKDQYQTEDEVGVHTIIPPYKLPARAALGILS